MSWLLSPLLWGHESKQKSHILNLLSAAQGMCVCVSVCACLGCCQNNHWSWQRQSQAAAPSGGGVIPEKCFDSTSRMMTLCFLSGIFSVGLPSNSFFIDLSGVFSDRLWVSVTAQQDNAIADRDLWAPLALNGPAGVSWSRYRQEMIMNSSRQQQEDPALLESLLERLLQRQEVGKRPLTNKIRASAILKYAIEECSQNKTLFNLPPMWIRNVCCF